MSRANEFVRAIVGYLAGEKGVWIVQPQKPMEDTEMIRSLRSSYPQIWGPPGQDRFKWLHGNRRGKWLVIWVEDE